MAGGFPKSVVATDRERWEWHTDYIRQLLSDLRLLARIRRIKAMRDLLASLAAWSSKVVDVTKIGRSLDVSRPTLDSYINAAEMMFVIDRVPAWVDSDYERGMRRDKLFMCDSGLMAGVLGWDPERVKDNSDACGKLLETYAHNQLASLVDVDRYSHELYHYRDRDGREIDFVIRHRSGDVLGIKVKAASAVGTKAARHLRWFGDNLVKDGRFTGLVLHTGNYTHRLGEGVWAVPFSVLWE